MKGIGTDSFLDWIGLRKRPNYEAASWLGSIVGFALALIVVVLAVGGIATLLQFLTLVSSRNFDHEAVRNVGLALIAVLGAPFVVWRAAVAQKQADTGEQSHITDQINKAVAGLGSEKTVDRIGRPVNVLCGESRTASQFLLNPADFQLPARSIERSRQRESEQRYDEVSGDVDVVRGVRVDFEVWPNERTDIEWQGQALQLEAGAEVYSRLDWTVFSETLPNIEVRIGAIYALERISQDSTRDHIRVMEILSAYIRENAPVVHLTPSEVPFQAPRLRTDIQAALDVIGRRSSESILLEHKERFRLDLRKSDLSGGNFEEGQFEGALLIDCRLEVANLRNANLRGARLQGSLLNFAEFFNADLCGALIDSVTITKLGPWQSSILGAKDTRGLSMAGSDLSALSVLPKGKAHEPTFGTKDTFLAGHLDTERQERMTDIEQFSYLLSGIDIDEKAEVLGRLTGSGFLGWSPFEANDGANGSLRLEVWKMIGLSGFPFE